jgi:integrase
LQAADQLVIGDAWVNTGHVFTTGLRAPIYPDTVTQLFGKAVRAYHDLRHVHATMLLVAGVPVHVVAERLGHADPSVTLRAYAHVIRRHAAGVADIFAAAVDEVAPVSEEENDEDGPEAEALVPR